MPSVKHSVPTLAELDQLIERLYDQDDVVRLEARDRVVRLGEAAVEPLVKMLDEPEPRPRWEAIKSLEELASPRSIPALIKALDDEIPGIRYMAAHGLVAIGPEALPPLLMRLVESPHAGWLREGAHHVLYYYASHDELGPIVQPVLQAMRASQPGIAVPFAAAEARQKLLAQQAVAQH